MKEIDFGGGEKYKTGDKIKFTGTKMFWFTDMIENGDKLIRGKKYTISYLEMASCWTMVKLKETGQLQYNLGWFKKV